MSLKQTLIQSIAEKLTEKNHYLVTAESCTGGGIACALTDIAGSSVWFDRAFVTYSNEAKQDMLGVSATCLETHGAVSDATVIAMAEGALLRSRANISVAVSGIAGPAGGSIDKPVGTVYFAWAGDEFVTKTQHKLFGGDRHAVREQAILFALREIDNLLSGD